MLHNRIWNIVIFMGVLVCLLFFVLSACKSEMDFYDPLEQFHKIENLSNQAQIDSILNSWEENLSFEKRYNRCIALLKFSHYKAPKLAWSLAEESLQLAFLMDEDLKEAESLYWVALLKSRRKSYGEAIEETIANAEISRRIFERNADDFKHARSANLIGIMYENVQEMDRSRKYQNLADSLLTGNTSLEGEKLRCEIIHDLGNTYIKGNSDEAKKRYKQANDCYEKNGNYAARARLQINMANMFAKEGKEKEAEEYFLESLKYANENQDIELQILVKEAFTQFLRGKYDRWAEKGKVNNQLFEQGIQLCQDLLEVMEESLFKTYIQLARWYHLHFFYSGDSQDIKIAYNYYLDAMESAAKEGEINLLEGFSLNVKELCDNPASPCFEDYNQKFNDFQQSQYRQVLELDRRIQLLADKKIRNYEKRKAEQQIDHQRILLFGSISLSLLLVLIFLFIFFRLSKQKMQARIETLLAQINPHFVSNTINAIDGLMNLDKKELASEYLADFADLNRSIMKGSRYGKHSLAEEIFILGKYMSLLKLRFPDKLSYKVEVAKGLPENRVQIPAMIVQPFVENAYAHGIKLKEGPGLITVRFERKGEHLLVIVDDDGIGFKASEKLKKQRKTNHEPQGVAITQERIEIISKSRGKKVKIFDKRELMDSFGTRVELLLPYEEKP